MESFKNSFSFEKRKAESDAIRLKYPERIPIIVERSPNCTNLPELKQRKFLVPQIFTLAQLMSIIRKDRLVLKPDQALFVSFNGVFCSAGDLIGMIYKSYADEDGFLYCQYTSESTFG